MDNKYCTECENPFLPDDHHDDHEEFRLCSDCKNENPEVMEYLNKYVYEPKKNNTWTPFQDRLAKLMRKLQILESDMDAFKNIYCEEESESELDRQVVRKLQILQSDLDAFKNINCEEESEDELDCQVVEYDDDDDVIMKK